MEDITQKTEARYSADALIDFATTLLEQGGLAEERARIVASTLVEADLMGHTTHGLQLLVPYVEALENGTMTATGDPVVVQDRGAAVTWDGCYLPGPWLTHRAIDLALERVVEHPVITVVIQKSHHIACLAAYLERATERGLLLLLASSDPSNKAVAPYGGLRAVYSPNPIAVGIPTKTEPILFDISMSTTANGNVLRAAREGKRLPQSWLLDGTGTLTDDPQEVCSDPPATILPLGGLDAGYKGFALGLFIEALTSGLAGYGRVQQPKRWSGSVFVQLLDPEAFGGGAAFRREMEYLAESCRAAETRPGDPPVRLPGSRALRLREEQRKTGVWLYPTIIPDLQACAEKYGVAFPEPVAASM